MRRERPCRSCIHFEWCKGRELCNSYISKEQMNNERLERDSLDRAYMEYWEAYSEYVDDDRD